MPVALDPDAAAVYKAFQEAGRPPYETVTRAGSARICIWHARVVANPEPPELESAQAAVDPRAAWRDPGAHLHAEDAAQDQRPRAVPGVLTMAAAG